MIEASYAYLREFTPAVLAAVDFAGNTETRPLLTATERLRELNASRARKVPAGTPEGFVPSRWRGYLTGAASRGDSTAYRHYWEIALLYGLRDGLRSGDVFVPGSRRYTNPAASLMPPDQWQSQREQFCHLVGTHPGPQQALAAAEARAACGTGRAGGHPGRQSRPGAAG